MKELIELINQSLLQIKQKEIKPYWLSNLNRYYTLCPGQVSETEASGGRKRLEIDILLRIE